MSPKKRRPRKSQKIPALAVVLPLAVLGVLAWLIAARRTDTSPAPTPMARSEAPDVTSAPPPPVPVPQEPAASTPAPVSPVPADRDPSSSRAPVSSADLDLPPLPFPPAGGQQARTMVREAYEFAAKHPDVLGHIPCFCGCERSGHQANDDCFVTSRDARGRVTAWDSHGFT